MILRNSTQLINIIFTLSGSIDARIVIQLAYECTARKELTRIINEERKSK